MKIRVVNHRLYTCVKFMHILLAIIHIIMGHGGVTHYILATAVCIYPQCHANKSGYCQAHAHALYCAPATSSPSTNVRILDISAPGTVKSKKSKMTSLIIHAGDASPSYPDWFSRWSGYLAFLGAYTVNDIPRVVTHQMISTLFECDVSIRPIEGTAVMSH